MRAGNHESKGRQRRDAQPRQCSLGGMLKFRPLREKVREKEFHKYPGQVSNDCNAGR
ncbi:protein of unknown function [Pararobbsia alpina]